MQSRAKLDVLIEGQRLPQRGVKSYYMEILIQLPSNNPLPATQSKSSLAILCFIMVYDLNVEKEFRITQSQIVFKCQPRDLVANNSMSQKGLILGMLGQYESNRE